MEKNEYHAMAALEESFWWYRALHDFVLFNLEVELSGIKKPVIVDAGCGTGGMLAKIEKKLPEAVLLGFEYDTSALSYAVQKTRADLFNASVNSWPLADDTVDLVVSMDVMYHQNVNEQQFLGEVFRCLKPGGVLLMNLPAFNWMRSAHDRQVHTRSRYTTASVEQLLTESGIFCEYAGYRNSLLFPLMVIHRLTAGQIKQSSDVSEPNKWLNTFFYQINRFEQLLWKRGIRLPFGGSVWVKGVKPE
ncbi:MAG: class I SAM-dependent methyltransferase [Pseudomonadales bacterium]|nr:class I SAM-dependent methyltransferase [Pseudomonadales bacterium]